MSNPIVMADNDLKQITASIDGATYRVLAGGKDFIMDNIGQEFAITNASTSLQVSIGTGEALICGRTFKITSALNLTLSASNTVDVCLRIDLSQPSGSEGSLHANTPNTYTQQDLNNNGSVYDFPLYRVVTGTSGVNSVTDLRNIFGGTSLRLVDGKFWAYDYATGTSKKLGEVTGTATPQQVLSGATFMSANDEDNVQTGTIPFKSSATYNTSTADQTIASGQYLSGVQTIKAVTTSNLTPENIKSGVVVKVGDVNNAGRIKNVTGTYNPTANVKRAIAFNSYVIGGAVAKIDLGSTKTIKRIEIGAAVSAQSEVWSVKYGTSSYTDSTYISSTLTSPIANVYDVNLTARYIQLAVGGNSSSANCAHIVVYYQ